MKSVLAGVCGESLHFEKVLKVCKVCSLKLLSEKCEKCLKRVLRVWDSDCGSVLCDFLHR